MKKSIAILFAMLVLVSGRSLLADATNSNDALESRLRAALQQTAQQLRDEQDQLAAAQAAQVQSDQEKAALQAKLEAANAQVAVVTKQDADDKAAAAAAANDFNAKIGDLNAQLDKYKATLDAWEKDDKANAQLIVLKEGARAQLAAENLILQRSLDDRERENLALYKLGDEILTRYRNFGLGDALAAKEPFIGTSRVRLQTLVQNYRDKLLDHVITPGQPAANASSSSANNALGGPAVRQAPPNATTATNP